MTNAVQEQSVSLGLDAQKEINAFLFATYGIMKSLGKYPRKSLMEMEYCDDGVVSHYNWGEENDPDNYWFPVSNKKFHSMFLGIDFDSKESKWVIRDTQKQGRDASRIFKFPFRKLKTDAWRKKITLWMGKHFFSLVYGKEEVDNFLSSDECIYQSINNQFLWE